MLFFDELSIELTKKCKFNCIYCSSESSNEKEEKIDVSRLKEIIERARITHRCKTISLSGGDPFLHPHFFEIFNFLRENNFKIKIFSCGILVNENDQIIPISREFLKKIKINTKNPEIHLNLQGYDETSIENINGTIGSYGCILRTISNINLEDLFLGANVVPFKNNFQNLEKIYDFCLEQKFDQINFLRFVPQGRGRDKDLCLKPLEFYEVQKSLVNILEKSELEKNDIIIRIGHPINFLFLLGKENLYSLENDHCCRGGKDAPLIMPDGTVAMCPAWKELSQFSPGNIYDYNLPDIWRSREFELFREFVENGYHELGLPCKECEFLDECKGKCVAQRLLSSSNIHDHVTFNELYRYAPDPLCFKHLINQG